MFPSSSSSSDTRTRFKWVEITQWLETNFETTIFFSVYLKLFIKKKTKRIDHIA